MSDERSREEVFDDIEEKFAEGPDSAFLDSREWWEFERSAVSSILKGDLEKRPKEHARITIARLASTILEEHQEIQEEMEKEIEDVMEEFSDEPIPEEKLRESVSWAEERGKQREIILKIHDEIILFFTLSYALIEEFSQDVLEKELIAEEFQESSGTEELLNRRFSQGTRESLLLRCGILDNGVISEMGHVRKVRNQLTHNVDHHQFLEPMENIESEINRTIIVLNELHQILDGKSFLVLSG